MELLFLLYSWQESYNFSYNFQGQYTLPPDANSPINHMNSHSVEDFDNLGVVVWVQDVNTKEILQSTTASIVANVEENLATSRLMIFPNPTTKITLTFLLNHQKEECLKL